VSDSLGQISIPQTQDSDTLILLPEITNTKIRSRGSFNVEDTQEFKYSKVHGGIYNKILNSSFS
jgi:hypothetical protein